eukprot:131828_1
MASDPKRWQCTEYDPCRDSLWECNNDCMDVPWDCQHKRDCREPPRRLFAVMPTNLFEINVWIFILVATIAILLAAGGVYYYYAYKATGGKTTSYTASSDTLTIVCGDKETNSKI